MILSLHALVLGNISVQMTRYHRRDPGVSFKTWIKCVTNFVKTCWSNRGGDAKKSEHAGKFATCRKLCRTCPMEFQLV